MKHEDLENHLKSMDERNQTSIAMQLNEILKVKLQEMDSTLTSKIDVIMSNLGRLDSLITEQNQKSQMQETLIADLRQDMQQAVSETMPNSKSSSNG